MTTEKLYIAAILRELKLSEAKVQKTNRESVPVLILEGGKPPAGYSDVEKWKRDAQSDFMSIKDTLKRKSALKAALVKSNAVEKVEIAGKTYTVADAIEKRLAVEGEKLIIGQHRQYLTRAQGIVDKKNENLEERITEHVQKMIGKDEVKKMKAEDYKEVDKFYRERLEAKLVDPLNLKDELDKWETEIEEFEKNVDIQLQISNATVQVEVTY
jgi:hypothetical protein